MLERNVQVFADLFFCLDKLDKAVGDTIRIGVEQPYPAKILDFDQFADQFLQAGLPFQVCP